MSSSAFSNRRFPATGLRLAAAALAAAAALGWTAPEAGARVTTAVTLDQFALQGRLVVTITNTRPFTLRDRPRTVVLRYGRRTYRLRRAARVAGGARAGASAAATSVWRTPTSSRAYVRLLGRRVSVIVRRRTGVATLRRTVTRPRPVFRRPPRNVQGQTAFDRIRRYFVGSRFTDCPEGWPACPTERRFDHCAGGGMTGNWRQALLPAGLATSGRYEVRRASYNRDGSWAVGYVVTEDSGTQAAYTWLVRPDGTAFGGYARGDETGILRGFRWQQPGSC